MTTGSASLPSSKRVLGPQYEELEIAVYPLTELAALASHFDQLTLRRVGGLTLARRRGSVAELATLEMPRGTLHLPLTRLLGCRLAGMSSRSRSWTTFFLAIGELVTRSALSSHAGRTSADYCLPACRLTIRLNRYGAAELAVWLERAQTYAERVGRLMAVAWRRVVESASGVNSEGVGNF
jgi:hypothetical protein